MIKIFRIIFLCIMLLGLSGCGKEDTGNLEDAKKYAEQFFRDYYLRQAHDINDIWKDSISETSKRCGITTEAEYVALYKEEQETNWGYGDFHIESADQLQPGIFRIRILYSYGYYDSNYTDVPSDFYVRYENGQYKTLIYGITDELEIKDRQDKANDILLENLKAWQTADGMIVSFDLTNHSDRDIVDPDTNDKVTVTLTTDDGQEYKCRYGDLINEFANYSNHKMIWFAGAGGKPLKLTVDNLNYRENGMKLQESTSVTVDLQ